MPRATKYRPVPEARPVTAEDIRRLWALALPYNSPQPDDITCRVRAELVNLARPAPYAQPAHAEIAEQVRRLLALLQAHGSLDVRPPYAADARELPRLLTRLLPGLDPRWWHGVPVLPGAAQRRRAHPWAAFAGKLFDMARKDLALLREPETQTAPHRNSPAVKFTASVLRHLGFADATAKAVADELRKPTA